MIALLLIIVLLFPVLSFPVLLTSFIYYPRYRSFLALLIALVLGVIAYYLNPPVTYDLYRHHEALDSLKDLPIEVFLSSLTDVSEPVTHIIGYVISKLGNNDLLQLIVTTLSYWIILYIIGDYSYKKGLPKKYVLLILVFYISSISYIYTISGLWNNLAIILFALGVYIDKFTNKSKLLVYVLYLITPLIHTGMLFGLIVLTLWKIFKEKLNVLGLTGIVVIFLPAVVLWGVSLIGGVPMFSQIGDLYKSYFLTPDYVSDIYNSTAISVELMKLIPIIILTLAIRDFSMNMKTLILYLSLAIIFITPSSLIMIRFVLLVQLVAIPMMITILLSKHQSRLKMIYICYMGVSALVFAIYQLYSLSRLDFGELVPDGIVTALPWILMR